jgi:hypothetical protein
MGITEGKIRKKNFEFIKLMVSVAVEEKGSLTTCHDLKSGITLTFSRKN